MSLPVPASVCLPLIQDSTTAGKSRQQDEQEILALFDEFRNPLLRYLSSFGVTAPDGEEVIQEVFLSLFQHLQKDKPRQNLRGWIFRVAHNLGLKRRARVRRDLVLHPGVAVEDFAADPAPNPEEHLAQRRSEQIIVAVLQALPDQDRQCLSLRAEGLTYREVADVLNISLGGVSQSLARSVARIARATNR